MGLGFGENGILFCFCCYLGIMRGMYSLDDVVNSLIESNENIFGYMIFNMVI